MEDKKKRIDALVEDLTKHMYRYYTTGDPTVSDAEYDALYDELCTARLPHAARIIGDYYGR